MLRRVHYVGIGHITERNVDHGDKIIVLEIERENYDFMTLRPVFK